MHVHTVKATGNLMRQSVCEMGNEVDTVCVCCLTTLFPVRPVLALDPSLPVCIFPDGQHGVLSYTASSK